MKKNQASFEFDQRNLVMFQVDRQVYALPIEPIVQIIEMVAVTPLPQVNHLVKGVINLHGEIVPVFDLRRYFGLPDTGKAVDAHIILVRAGKRKLGLMVDRVSDVISLPAEHIARPTDILPEGLGETPLVQGVAQTDGGMVLLLNLDGLLGAVPNSDLARVLPAPLPPQLTEPLPLAPERDVLWMLSAS